MTKSDSHIMIRLLYDRIVQLILWQINENRFVNNLFKIGDN